MTIEVQNISRVRVRSESSFGTDMTSGGSSFSNFTDLPIIEGSVDMRLTRAPLPVAALQQYHDDIEEDVFGLYGWSLSFSMYLSPTGTAANASTTAVTSGVGTLLKAIMGGENLKAGTTVVSGTAGGFVCTTAHGTRVPIGCAVGLLTGASSALEAREVVARSTDTVTLRENLSGSATGVAYRSATYSLTQDPQESLQFVVEGYELQDRWVLMGGQGSFALDFALGEIPRITFNLQGVYWINYTGAALSDASISAFSPTALTAGEFHIQTVATRTKNTVDVASVSFEPGISYVAVKSPSGVQTVKRWRRLRSVPVMRGSFTTYYEDQTYYTARDNRLDKSIFLQIGNAAGSTILIAAPTVQITDVQRTSVDGLAGQTVTWKARNDGDIGGVTDIGLSPFRIHFL